MKVIKFCISLLAIQSAQTLSTEKSASIVNTTGIQFTPQPRLPVWFINATWAGCDWNESIAYCDEMVEKNQTNSSKECFEEKGCCEGDSETGFIACPKTSALSHFFYVFTETITFYTLWQIMYRSSASTQSEKISVRATGVGSLVTLILSFLFEINASKNPETWQKSAINVGISFASGLGTGCGTSLLLRWLGNCRRQPLAEPLINQLPVEPNRRLCC